MSSKMREALLKASFALASATHHDLTEDDAKECLAVVEDALAEPLKNCEVGTPEEQAKRFKNYCDSKACKRNVCHSNGYEELFHHECFPIWAQMPYETVKTNKTKTNKGE